MGSLRNDCDDINGNENGKKKKKTSRLTLAKTTLYAHHAFLYIPLPSQKDCNVKMGLKFSFRGERQHKTKTFFSLSLKTRYSESFRI